MKDAKVLDLIKDIKNELDKFVMAFEQKGIPQRYVMASIDTILLDAGIASHGPDETIRKLQRQINIIEKDKELLQTRHENLLKRFQDSHTQ